MAARTARGVPASAACLVGRLRPRHTDTSTAVKLPPRASSRGLHSFPFQLNLSSSVHHMTQINS